MSTKKGRIKLKDKFDTHKNEVPFQLSYVKKSLLTSCRRVGLSKKKVNSPSSNESSPISNLKDDGGSFCSNEPNEASTSKFANSKLLSSDEKPKNTTSRRKKSSHPLKRNVNDTNSSDSDILTFQIVSPVSKRRKLDLIDIFNPDKVIISDKKSSKSSDSELKASSFRSKNNNGNSLTVSLPLTLSKNVLNLTKKGVKSDKNDTNGAPSKISEPPDGSVVKDVPMDASPAVKTLKSEDKPLKKRKIKEQNEIDSVAPAEEVSTKTEIEKEAEIIVGKVATKSKKKHRKLTRSRTPKIKLISDPIESQEVIEISIPRKGKKTRSKKIKVVNNQVDHKNADNNLITSTNESQHENLTLTDKPLSSSCNITQEGSYNVDTVTTTTENTNIETEPIAVEETVAVEVEAEAQDNNALPHIRNKAEKKIYMDLPVPEIVFTPPRNVKSPKSSPRAKKMDCDQLSEESYESSHYSPPAYSPIESRLPEEQFLEIHKETNEQITIEIPEETPLLLNQECASTFVSPQIEPVLTILEETRLDGKGVGTRKSKTKETLKSKETIPTLVEKVVRSKRKVAKESPKTEDSLPKNKEVELMLPSTPVQPPVLELEKQMEDSEVKGRRKMMEALLSIEKEFSSQVEPPISEPLQRETPERGVRGKKKRTKEEQPIEEEETLPPVEKDCASTVGEPAILGTVQKEEEAEREIRGRKKQKEVQKEKETLPIEKESSSQVEPLILGLQNETPERESRGRKKITKEDKKEVEIIPIEKEPSSLVESPISGTLLKEAPERGNRGRKKQKEIPKEEEMLPSMEKKSLSLVESPLQSEGVFRGRKKATKEEQPLKEAETLPPVEKEQNELQSGPLQKETPEKGVRVRKKPIKENLKEDDIILLIKESSSLVESPTSGPLQKETPERGIRGRRKTLKEVPNTEATPLPIEKGCESSSASNLAEPLISSTLQKEAEEKGIGRRKKITKGATKKEETPPTTNQEGNLILRPEEPSVLETLQTTQEIRGIRGRKKIIKEAPKTEETTPTINEVTLVSSPVEPSIPVVLQKELPERGTRRKKQVPKTEETPPTINQESSVISMPVEPPISNTLQKVAKRGIRGRRKVAKEDPKLEETALAEMPLSLVESSVSGTQKETPEREIRGRKKIAEVPNAEMPLPVDTSILGEPPISAIEERRTKKIMKASRSEGTGKHKENSRRSQITKEVKTKLLNYYPRVLLNMDDVDNYYKGLELQKQQALKEVKPRKVPRKRRSNTPFGFRRKKKQKIKIDEENEEERLESVFFTPPSSRSGNESDSNKNDFNEVNNPFGEGTSMDCITPITSKVTSSNSCPISGEDREVASLSNTESESRLISHLSNENCSFDLESSGSRPVSRLGESPSESSGLKTYTLNENGSVTVVQRGQCVEYIKWSNSAKRKSLRTIYSKSSILNRCVYNEPGKITSIFDSVLENDEPCSSSSVDVVGNLPKPIEVLRQCKDVEMRIKAKKVMLDRLKKCDTLVKDTTELRKRAQGALLEFAAYLRQQSKSPFNMESLLYNMSIPHHVVGYNVDDDDFI